jgi:hypothetical protein
MSLALQGVLVCVCLIGTGIFLFLRDPAKLTSETSPKQLRQGGVIGLIMGALMAVVAVYLFLRGGQ